MWKALLLSGFIQFKQNDIGIPPNNNELFSSKKCSLLIIFCILYLVVQKRQCFLHTLSIRCLFI